MLKFPQATYGPEWVGMKCEKCGAQNSPGLEKCGNCGAFFHGVQPESEPTASLDSSRARENKAEEPSSISEPVVSVYDVPHETIRSEGSIFSVAVNIRRIFLVMLTFLAIVTIELTYSLYLMTVDDPTDLRASAEVAIAGCVIVVIAGGYYAIRSKRLSE